MQRVALLLLAVMVVGPVSACKYWCKNSTTQDYECCDDGNPYYQPDEEETPSEAPVAPAAGEEQVPTSSGCYYYCSYNGEVYCCGDDKATIPKSHKPNEGRCPEEDEQVCKSTGIFLVTKKAKLAKISGSIQLVSGEGKEQPMCASDGYCAEDQKCCPSKCAGHHICLKSLKDETDNEEDLDEKQ